MSQLSVSAPLAIAADSVVTWDEERDFVVVGSGVAGVCAAIEAREAGLDVLVLERASGPGGASGMSGGHLYMGGGTPVQAACGFTDTADAMFNYLMALTPDPDEQRIRDYCNNSVAHFHWLEAHGVPFDRSYFPGKAAMQPGKDCLIWSGNEKAWPFRDKAVPAPRGHKVAFDGPDGGGNLLMTCLWDAADKAGVVLYTDGRVTNLVTDASGAVVGVAVKRDGRVQHIRARHGVLLAAGGYIFNDVIFDNELAWMPRDLIKHGVPGDDCAGILLGVSAGGEPRGMDAAFLTSPYYPPDNMLKGVVVNSEGQRFIAEDVYHGRMAGNIMKQPDGVAYLLLDSEIFDYPPYDFFEQRLVDGYETVAEMEAGLELPAGSLQATIARFNENAARGEDPDHGKYIDWLRPLDKPPYAAFDLSKHRAKFAGFSLGGIATNARSEALRADGTSIPGLYVAGSCAWGIAQDAAGYSSGTCLGEGSYFGRVAGQQAATSVR